MTGSSVLYSAVTVDGDVTASTLLVEDGGLTFMSTLLTGSTISIEGALGIGGDSAAHEIVGGVSVETSGLVVSGGLSLRDVGIHVPTMRSPYMTVFGGRIDALGGLQSTDAFTVSDGTLDVTDGGVLVIGGLSVLTRLQVTGSNDTQWSRLSPGMRLPRPAVRLGRADHPI